MSLFVTIEKLEIERRYWAAKGINWGIVTNKDINDVRAKNIEWIHSAMTSDDCNGLSREEFDDLLDGLLYRLIDNQQNIREIISRFEKDYSLDAGAGLLLFKHLIAGKKIALDMDKPINLNESGSSLRLPETSGKGGHEVVKIYS